MEKSVEVQSNPEHFSGSIVCLRRTLEFTYFHVSVSPKLLPVTLPNVPHLSSSAADVPLLSASLQIILVPELGLQQPTFVRD